MLQTAVSNKSRELYLKRRKIAFRAIIWLSLETRENSLIHYEVVYVLRTVPKWLHPKLEFTGIDFLFN